MWAELQAWDSIDELDSDDRDDTGTAHDDTNKSDEDGKAVTDTDDREADTNNWDKPHRLLIHKFYSEKW